MLDLLPVLAAVALSAALGSLWIRSRVRAAAAREAARVVLPADAALVRCELRPATDAQARRSMAALEALGYRAVSSYRLEGVTGLELIGFTNPRAGTMAMLYRHGLGTGLDLLSVHENFQVIAVSGGADLATKVASLEPYPRVVHAYLSIDLATDAAERGVRALHERLLELAPASRAVQVNQAVLETTLELSYTQAVRWRTPREPG